MKSYLELLSKIVEEGTEKEAARPGMPKTKSIHGAVLKHDLSEGFPLLTTKKMHLRGIYYELIWFLLGETNMGFLLENGVNIWNDDAFRWYNTRIKQEFPNTWKPLTKEEFLQNVLKAEFLSKNGEMYVFGDLGKIYGHQWRNQNGVDQVANVLNSLKENPNSRYHIIDAWNPSDKDEMALPPCHLLYQFMVRDNKLDLVLYQRSCDTPLGVPYNIASMALLVHLFAPTVNLIPGEITWVGGDVHIYENQLNAIKTQLERKPYKLPVLNIKKELKCLTDIFSLDFDDIQLTNYQHHEKINIKLSVGI